MIQLNETLGIHTVEGFLSPEQLAPLADAVEEHLAATGWQPTYVGQEMDLPDTVNAVLSEAVARHLPEIRQVFPSAAGASPWQYIQFEPGQGADRHLDGIGVTLQEAAAGGQFFIETTSSDAQWDPRHAQPAPARAPYAPDMRFTHTAHHYAVADRLPQAAWLATVRGVPWTTPAGPGVGVVYGAQLIHGITPVTAGRCRKFITGLTDTP